MKEKIKKILRTIATIGAVLWIFIEIVSNDYYDEPNLTVVVGILTIWAIIIYSLKETSPKLQAIPDVISNIVPKSNSKHPSEIILGKNIRFCHNCGSKIEEESTFCTQCGIKLSDKPKENWAGTKRDKIKKIGYYKESTDNFLCLDCFFKTQGIIKKDYRLKTEEDLKKNIYTCDECKKEF